MSKKVDKKLEILPKLPENIGFKQFAQPISGQQNSSEQFKILEDLQDSEKNLELKTEINKPFSFAVLSVYSKFLRDLDFIEIADIIDNFKKEYYKLNISKKRAGRKEIIDALKSAGLQLNSFNLPNLPNNPMMNQQK